MGFHVSCDYCGEEVVGHFATLDFGGYYNDHPGGRLGSLITRDRLYFHSGDDEDDETSCLAQVQRLLNDVEQWAHRKEGSGLVWRLVPQAPVIDPNGGVPIGEEFRKRVETGTALYRLDGLSRSSVTGLREANLVTLEEVAGRTEEEVRAVSGVGPKSFHRLQEELTRRGLSFCEASQAEAIH